MNLLLSAATLFTMSVALGSSCLESINDDKIEAWHKIQSSIQSLVIKFDVTVDDKNFGETESRKGVFRLVRTSQNLVAADFDIGSFATLLHNDAAYFLDPNRRFAIRFDPHKDKRLEFIGTEFLPIALLLDRRLMEKHFDLKWSRDESYDYLLLRPKTISLQANLVEARVSIVRHPTESIPVGVPKQLWIRHPNKNEIRYDITSWEINSKTAPSYKDIVRPEDRAGWTVSNAGRQTPREYFWNRFISVDVRD